MIQLLNFQKTIFSSKRSLNLTTVMSAQFKYSNKSPKNSLGSINPAESKLSKTLSSTDFDFLRVKEVILDKNSLQTTDLNLVPGYTTEALHKKFVKFVEPKAEQEFLGLRPSIIKDLSNLDEFKGISATNDRVRRILEYNLMLCTSFGAMIFLSSHAHFCSTCNEENSPKHEAQNKLAYVLAWCTELLIASFLVLDDMVDESKSRFGQPCWYIRGFDTKGNFTAAYDALMLQRCAYSLLKRHFKIHPMYCQLHNLFRKVMTSNNYSMALEGEINSSFAKTGRLCSIAEYCNLIKWQNGFIVFYLPMALAAILNGVTQPKILKQLETVCLDISLHFAIWKDHSDCFYETELLDDEGSDIKNGRVTWLLLRAMEIGTPEQQRVLQDNIGKPYEEKVELVLQVYRDIGVSNMLKQWEKSLYTETVERISGISSQLPQYYLKDLLSLFSFHLAYP